MASQSLQIKVDDFCTKLRQRKVDGSLSAAKGTAELLRQLVTSYRIGDPRDLLDEVKAVGNKIQAARSAELVIGNIVRRVMHIIREEMEEEADDDDSNSAVNQEQQPSTGGLSRAFKPSLAASRALSLHNLLDQCIVEEAMSASVQREGSLDVGRPSRSSFEKETPPSGDRRNSLGAKQQQQGGGSTWDRKQEVIDGVNDLIEELKDIDIAIAAQAVEHIHANEVILTFGYSRTVFQFLCRAREKRNFQVVVAEAAPTLQGHNLARELADCGIRTTAIPDAAIYALMARVNKVVVSAHALLADGGIMAPVGMNMVAMAAKRHSVPFVVLVGLYKLSPLFPHEPDLTFNELKDPEDMLPYDNDALLAVNEADGMNTNLAEEAVFADSRAPHLQVHNPSYDYVPPELISLFITDHGHGFMPSYVYRQLSEFYHRQDYSLND